MECDERVRGGMGGKGGRLGEGRVREGVGGSIVLSLLLLMLSQG